MPPETKTAEPSAAYRCSRAACRAPASIVPVPRSRPLMFKFKCSSCGAESLPFTTRERKAEQAYRRKMRVDASRRIAQRQNPPFSGPYWWAV